VIDRIRPVIRGLSIVSSLGILAATAAPASAEDWSFSFTPYVWVPDISAEAEIGSVAPGGNIGSTSGSSGILDFLDLALLAHIEASKGRFAFFGDIVYLELSTDFASDAFTVGPVQVGPIEIDADVDGKILEFGGGYEVWRDTLESYSAHRQATIELIGGVRLSRLDFSSRLATTVSGAAGGFARQLSGGLGFTIDLADPIVGTRVSLPLGEDWTVRLRGDIGGFGVDSDLTWNTVLAVSYQMFDHTSLVLGYRALGYDFEVNQAETSTKLNLRFHGPLAAVTFSW